MKLFIIGTSNSVMRGNYISALSERHEVINLSVGRTPVIMHLKTILEKRQEIETGDVLIIDHYINDMVYYAAHYPEDYPLYVEDFYKLLSSLNINVINIFFPIHGYRHHPKSAHYHHLIALSKKYKITRLDLNRSGFLPDDFRNRTHLSEKASYEFGRWLAATLKQSAWSKPKDGKILDQPYTILHFQHLNTGRPLRQFTNSLVDIKFVRITEPIEIPTKGLGELIGFSYFRINTSCDGAWFNEQPIVTSNNGYFVDLFEEKFPAADQLTIKPILGQGAFHSPNNYEYVEGEFKGTKLVELIFRKNKPLIVNSSKHHRIDLNYQRPQAIENEPFAT
ncbi:MAG TPA: hypothetical protein PLM98_02905 [Thiolinea sp.]|nr:hypothetical protein [Thiolinea sp.]